VLVASRQADVSDYEVITQYSRSPEGDVTGLQRVALYLQPQDALYFRSGGASVAVYDYRLTLERVPAPPDAVGAVSCVLTPKSVVQCM
jgi:hypothetical protein